MRESLAVREDERTTFRGRCERFGTKGGWKGRSELTVLLVDVRDAHGQPVCDHLWFNKTRGFAALHLQKGDIVEFDGRVTEYRKGYRGKGGRDYQLSRPTKVRKVQLMPPQEGFGF